MMGRLERRLAILYLLLFHAGVKAFTANVVAILETHRTRPPRRWEKKRWSTGVSSLVAARRHRCSYPANSSLLSLNASGNSSELEGMQVAIAFLSLFSITASVLTMWSEFSILATGCGPLSMSDPIERVSYQAVIACSGLAWFIRLVFRQGLYDFTVEQGILLTNNTTDDKRVDASLLGLTINLAEVAAYVAAGLAFLVLWNQVQNNVDMDGLSGINIEACKARRDLLLLN